jgi:hypothetical protein
MLAIGIFAMVLTAIYATWITILKGSRAGLKAAAEVQRSRIAMRTLEDAFNTAHMFSANIKHYLFFADTSGDFAAVSMAARLPASFPGVGRYGDQIVRRVSFYTQPGADGMQELWMTQAPLLLITNQGVEPYSLMLAKDVTLFSLQFFDVQTSEWLEEWAFTNKMPALVKIDLGLGRKSSGGSEPYDLVSSLVRIPLVAVQGDIQSGQGGFRGPPPLNPPPGNPNLPGSGGGGPGTVYPGGPGGTFPGQSGARFGNQPGFNNQPGSRFGNQPGNIPGGRNVPRR